ncbi:MAG: hypothetical protein K5695_06085 [Oscillospiraceae bacterium]|nr:hypothetical protein [Oscillospiraceae bacterium]
MKKRKRQSDDFHIETIYDPYRRSDDDTFNEIYQRYLEDNDRIIELNSLTYYKAAVIYKVTLHEVGIIVALPWKIEPENDCIIVDENGNQYEYRGCEMMRFSGEIPEWYFKMVFAILSFPEGDIGEYFAKQNINKE